MDIIQKIGRLLTEDPDVLNEVDMMPQDQQYRGSFVKEIPFVGTKGGERVKAKVLAEIRYTWDAKRGIEIHAYDVLEIMPKTHAHLLNHEAMGAIYKKIEDGSAEKYALQHFQNVNKTGPKAAKAFNRPRKRNQ
jgi:hypothetical protein